MRSMVAVTDGTVEYLESQGIPVYQQPKKGLNNGYRYAQEKAIGEAVVVFFPKGTIPPKDLLKFKEHFKKGFEFVVASRQIRGSQNEEDCKRLRFRKWAVLALGAFSALMWKKKDIGCVMYFMVLKDGKKLLLRKWLFLIMDCLLI